MASGLNYKYFHNSGFDAVKINGGTNALLRKHVQGVHPETLGIAMTLIGKLAADSRVTDIRYMAYMLATACHEARDLKPSPAIPAVVDNAKKSPPHVKKPANQWVIFNPINEQLKKGAKGLYINYVKVSLVPGGAIITEQDGDQLWVGIDGSFSASGKKNTFAKGGNRQEGSPVGGAVSAIYAADPGVAVHFQGRGLVQITWFYNYAKASVKLGRGLELLRNPELVKEPGIAYEIMVRGMLEGWFTGQTCALHFNDIKTDYVEARRIINGQDKAQPIVVIAQAFEDLLMASRLNAIAVAVK